MPAVNSHACCDFPMPAVTHLRGPRRPRGSVGRVGRAPVAGAPEGRGAGGRRGGRGSRPPTFSARAFTRLGADLAKFWNQDAVSAFLARKCGMRRAARGAAQKRWAGGCLGCKAANPRVFESTYFKTLLKLLKHFKTSLKWRTRLNNALKWGAPNRRRLVAVCGRAWAP